MMKTFFGCLGLMAASVHAAALKEAEFTRVINDVKILPVEAGPTAAKVGDRITGRTGVSTGAQSRAELRYPDKTLTRLGANSIFRMDQSSRTVEVEKGVILLQVPKQLGGAQVRTAAVTAAVTGTTLMVESTTDGHLKIIVIEGEVEVFLNDRRSVFRTLTAGDLWVTRADDSSGLPMPVKVDLKRLQKTSKLLNEAEFAPLGNEQQVEEALQEQARLKSDGELLATSFRIEGRGRQVTLTQGERQHVLGVREEAPRRVIPTKPGPVVGRKPAQKPDGGVVGPNKPVNNPETTVFDNRSTIRTVPEATAYNSAAGTFVSLPGSTYVPAEDGPFNLYMYDDPLAFTAIDGLLNAEDSWFVFKGDEIFVAGDVAVDTTGGPRSLILGASGDFRFSADTPFASSGLVTGNRWSLGSDLDSLVFSSRTGAVRFEDFTLEGEAQDVLFHADGPASDVRITGVTPSRISLPGGAFEAFAGRDVQVSGAAVEARALTMTAGRDVTIGAAGTGTVRLAASESIRIQAQQSVKITNSSQLRRLTELDNPQVMIEAVNGHLDLDGGSSIEADAVSLASPKGNLTVAGASISAREIKARVFDTGGTLLLSNAILGRGSNPSDLIRLYGEGAGGVRFTGDTTLRGTAVDIAGGSVTIDAGSRVRLANPTGTRVFADSHNYNNRTHGNFTGLGDGQAGARPVDVNQQPYANRPGF